MPESTDAYLGESSVESLKACRVSIESYSKPGLSSDNQRHNPKLKIVTKRWIGSLNK